MYGGDSAAALPDTVVRPPVAGAEGDTAVPASVVTGAAVVPGASAGPSAFGIGGKPHFTLSCSTFCSQYVLPALPRQAAHGMAYVSSRKRSMLVQRLRAPFSARAHEWYASCWDTAAHPPAYCSVYDRRAMPLSAPPGLAARLDCFACMTAPQSKSAQRKAATGDALIVVALPQESWHVDSQNCDQHTSRTQLGSLS